MNEQDRLVQVSPLRLGVDEGDVDPIRQKMLKFGGTRDLLFPHRRSF